MDRITSQAKQKIRTVLINYFNWLVAALALIILLSSYLFLIEPKYKKINRDIIRANEDSKMEYQIRQSYLEKLNKSIIAYNNVSEENKDKLASIIPLQPQLEQLYIEVESIILRNGLLLTSLRIEDEAAAKQTASSAVNDNGQAAVNSVAGQISKIKISLHLAGVDYNGLKNLLITLENNLRLMDVEQLAYNPAANDVSLEIYTYYLKNF